MRCQKFWNTKRSRWEATESEEEISFLTHRPETELKKQKTCDCILFSARWKIEKKMREEEKRNAMYEGKDN